MNLKQMNWQHWMLIVGAGLTTLGTAASVAQDWKNPATLVGVVVQVLMAVAAVNKQPPGAA